MGWSGANPIAERVAKVVEDHQDGTEERRAFGLAVLSELVEALRDNDWDTLDECMGQTDLLDEAIRASGWFGEEED